ncbi:hypothetical protein [Fontivita pretiosa]|uniref:hypothetical protein n=1 Tax=Fontivita pretiosa TaxID=2989684 RepID=UPI003D163382
MGMSAICDRVKQRGAEWLQQAQHLEYLNEIALSGAELETFLDDLKECRNVLNDTVESRFALAVAAVNWACYQQEDEGFRSSFTKRIFGIFDERLWAERLGEPIEAAIIHWRPRPRREGAFRFVGLIREQAGLSYFHLERFAGLLGELRSDPTWPAVPDTTDCVLQNAIRRHFGDTCAGAYLCSESGRAFIRAVCRDLVSYYLRRLLTLDDLDSARGYRPGVMRLIVEYLEHLGSDQSASQPRLKGHAWAEPRLMLGEDGRLYLQFDPGEVSRRLITCAQYDQPLYDCRIPIGAELLPRHQYSGVRTTSRGEEAWSARGWRPLGKDWALFDADRQFVCSSAVRRCRRIPTFL